MATKDGGGARSFGFISRATPFRSARSGGDAPACSSHQPQYFAQPGDGYHQMVAELPPLPVLQYNRHNQEPWLDHSYYKEALDSFNIYDPQFWLPTISLKVSGMMFYPWVIITIAAGFITYYFLELAPDHKEAMQMPLDAHIVMGGALSFLVVMRTDASMNRWWEARCSWQEIINCMSSIGAQNAPALSSPEATEMMLMQLMAFAISLKAWLRDTAVQREEIGGRMDWQYIRKLNASHNPPITALKALSHTCRTNLPDELGSAIYDETSEQIRVINHAVGACRKIKTTPMVFGYITTLRSFLVLWLTTLVVPLIGEFGWLAVPVLSLISYLFLNVEQMAVEIEQPFGDDANDLPIESYVMDLEKTLLEMTPGFKVQLDGEDSGSTTADDVAQHAGAPARQDSSISDELAQRVAALESLYQAERNAHAQQITQLTTELTKAREGRNEATRGDPGTPGAPLNGHDWNRVSPMWQSQAGGLGGRLSR